MTTAVNSFNSDAFEADCVEVISVTHDTGSDIYTVKFTKPVHLFRTGWVWLRQKNRVDSLSCACRQAAGRRLPPWPLRSGTDGNTP